MDHFHHPFVDISLLPSPSLSGTNNNNLSWDDYELYPRDSELAHPITNSDRAAQLHYQLSRMEDIPKPCSAEFAHFSQSQYTPWTEEPVSAYHVGYPIGMNNLNLPPPPPSSDQASSPWSGDFSSVSDGESPRTMNMEYGCYPSPPYSYDEPVRARTDAGGGYAGDGSGQSVALCQVQQYPDLDLGVKYEPEMVHVSLVPFPTGGMVQSVSQTPSQSQLQAQTQGLARTHSHTPQYDDLDTVSEVSYTPNTSTPVEIAAEPDIRPRAVTSSSRRGKTHRVNKRQIASRGTKNPSKGSSPCDKNNNNTTGRTFTCSFAHYGCPSTFVSKNEWKRHVASQHLQLGFYRCDVGPCNIHIPIKGTKPVANDFNRKDLFTQHQRRMHTPWQRRGKNHRPSEDEKNAFETSLDGVRARCWVQARYPPIQSRCGFCGKVFTGPQSWDERMEHVGRHFEKDEVERLGQGEEEDGELTRWAVEEGIVRMVRGGWRLSSLC